MAKRGGLELTDSKNIVSPIISTPSAKFKEQQNYTVGYSNLSPMLSKQSSSKKLKFTG